MQKTKINATKNKSEKNSWRDEAVALLQLGTHNYKEIAKQVNISEISVQKLAAEKGLTVRKVRKEKQEKTQSKAIESTRNKLIEMEQKAIKKTQKKIAEKNIENFKISVGENFNVYSPDIPTNTFLCECTLKTPAVYVSDYFIENDQTIEDIVGDSETFLCEKYPNRSKHKNQLFVLINNYSKEILIIEKL